MTPNRSAGRIEDPLWAAFLRKARAEGLSNTDAMRKMISDWTGVDTSNPGPPRDPGPPGVSGGLLPPSGV
jgi:hypothetical protein